MNWGHVVRNTAIAIGITFVTAVGVYLAIRLVVSARGFLEVNALFPETDGVCLDYRAHDATPRAYALHIYKDGKNPSHRLRPNKTGRLIDRAERQSARAL